MSPLFAERPRGRVHKCFGRKALRHFYVPFVASTEARKNAPRPSLRKFFNLYRPRISRGAAAVHSSQSRSPHECCFVHALNR
jgi:hypothetical protein